jgi:hypothetical protein
MIKIGIPVGSRGDIETRFARAKDMGLSCCQLGGNPFHITDPVIDEIIDLYNYMCL